MAARSDRGGLSFDDVLRLWREDDGFAAAWSAHLAGAPYAALRLECPPLVAGRLGGSLSCVLLDAPELVRPADPRPFRDPLDRAGEALVATFPNLSGDAVLVVPRGIGPPAAYSHLAAFLRDAPAPQVRALWRAVAAAMRARLGAAPVWLSTAGSGVPWLHVRLDDRPKYYVHAPYRRWPAP